MARTTRTRSRSRGVPAGTRTGTWLGVSRERVQFASLAVNEVCEDSRGRPVVASNFQLGRTDKTDYKGFSFEVINPADPLEKVIWKDYWYNYQLFGSIAHLPVASPPAGMGATIRSRTNPSRPSVTPLNLIQDIVELPRMLKDVGKLIRTPRKLLSPREQANAFLGAKFGWIPLVHDIHTLLHSYEYINSRFREIDSLYKKGGLRRRIQLGNDHAVSGSFQSLESEVISVTGTVSTGTSMKYWGSCRWIPTTPPGFNPSDAAKLRAAKSIVSGFTVDGLIKGAWDLLPWSWLIDWSANAGDWLTQHSNFVGASPIETCLMTEKNTVVQHSVRSAPKGFGDNGGVGLGASRTRTVVNGSLAASLPMLDVGRLSVLGALFVQRFKR